MNDWIAPHNFVIFDLKSPNEITELENKMIKAISLALLVGGIVLMIFGNEAMNSFSSNISRMFTGAPTDRAVFMMVGGLVMTVVGAFGVIGLIPGTKR